MNKASLNPKLAAAIAILSVVPFAVLSQSPNSLLPQWAPTELPAGRSYVGSQTCIGCHEQQSSALHTAMGDALQRPEGSEFLGGNELHKFENGPYSYEVQGSSYSVTDGTNTLTAPIVWSFGHGKAGQTYVLERDGQFYESRVSYYLEIEGLDQTLGAPLGSVPANIDEALGRQMTPDDIRGCFGCHSTGVVRSGQVTMDQLTPGVQCEGCHGPGERHVEAVAAGRLDDLQIEGHGDLGAEQESDLCGSCHRTWADVALMDLQGVANVRFQPYRLANSRCYDTEDARIRCSACHDAHEDPVQVAETYDANCLACHTSQGQAVTAARPGPACPTATTRCSDCHMPKIEIPGSHFAFTDHQIRVVRPGDAYPD